MKRNRSSSNSRWSGRVTRESNALDLESGVFTWSDPVRIALSLRESAERSSRRKAPPYKSAMSMLVCSILVGPVKTSTKIGVAFWNRPKGSCVVCTVRTDACDYTPGAQCCSG